MTGERHLCNSRGTLPRADISQAEDHGLLLEVKKHGEKRGFQCRE